jgi:hypothetical protein
MRKYSIPKIEISLFFLVLLVSIIACNFPGLPISDCEVVDRTEYEESARLLGQTPEIPKYPAGAKYEVCYTDGQLTSVRMTDGKKSDEETTIPVGTYSGESNFYTTLENDVENSYLAPVCTENTIQVVIGSDGVAQGEISSICYAKQDTDNEEMQMTHHSDVTGVIQGQLLDNAGQLSVVYTWHSYITSPQWETPSLDNTVDFEFLYNVNVSNDVMTFTPAGEVEDYYTFELTKQ